MSTKTSRYKRKTVKTRSLRTITIVCAAILIGVIVLALIVLKVTGPRDYTLPSAKVVAIDANTRTGTVEFVERKSGKTITARAVVPDDCEIKIDGQPATINDVHLGDKISAYVTYYWFSGRAVAHWVHVDRTRSAVPASGPAAASASAPAAPVSGPAK